MAGLAVGGVPEQPILTPVVNQTSEKRGREDEGGVQTERKWPGWPGDNVFRMIVSAQKVGAIIGRKGEFVKKMCDETRARIKILEGIPGAPERVVLVSAREEPDAVLSPAMDGILRVHKHIVEGGDGEGHNTNVSSSLPTIISARLLVAATQAGSLIGRQGSTIKSIQDNSGAVVRVLPADDFPYCALSDDRIVEIQSETPKVQKALELVVSHLRKFLVDRTVLQLYELNRTMTNAQNLVPGMWGNNAAMNFPINPQLGISSAYTASGPPYENYFTNFDPPNNQDLNMYGRDPASGGATMFLPPPAAPTATIIAQVSQQIQIPLSYTDAIIGAAGSNINYARQTSGATITIQEASTVPGEMTIEIYGTATQVQTAEQIIQNFMVGTSGIGTATYNTADTGYNYSSHSDQNSMYATTTSTTNSGLATAACGTSYNASYAY